MQSGRVISGQQVGTTRRCFSGWRSLVLAVWLLPAAAASAQAQTFSGGDVTFPASGSNTTQSQAVSITLATAASIRSISIPVGFTGSPEFIVVDQGGCVEDGTTVNAAGTVCHLVVRFHPAAAGLRRASLVITDGNGVATAFNLSGTGYYAQAAITPAAQRIVAGLGPTAAGFSGDGDASLLAALQAPAGLATDASGNIYVADTGNNVVRMLDAFGNITTVAGGGILTGADAEGALATRAQLNAPTYLAVDAAGNLYIADTGDHAVRMVAMSTTRKIVTIAGTYTPGFSDGTSATTARLNGPQGLAVDNAGNLYIADTGNARIRVVNLPSNVITTFAGSGSTGFDPGAVSALGAQFAQPTGLALDNAGNLLISDTGNHSVRQVAAGTVTIFAGTGAAGNTGDGAAAGNATFKSPAGIAVDAAGDVYIADTTAGVIRKVQAQDGVIETVAGEAKDAGSYSAGVTPSTSTRMNGPVGLAFDARSNLFITDRGNNVVREVSTAPGEVLFAAQAIGNTSSPVVIKIANLGSAPLTGISIAAANAATTSNFVLANSASNPCGSTLAPGSHCEYAVSFAPAASGFVAGEVDVTHIANNPNFNAVEPVYLAGGLIAPLTVGPATLPQAITGQPYTATVTVSGGYGAVKVDTESTLPAGLSASVTGQTVTLSGTSSANGTYSFNVFATDQLGATAAQAYTLQVAPATLTVSVNETINVIDTPVESPQLNLSINESIQVMDAVNPLPQLSLAILESVQVTDALVSLPQLALSIQETITVSDTPETAVSGKQTQTISASGIPAHTYGDAIFTPQASASSGLPVSVAVTSGPATVSNGVVDLTGGGTVTLSFTQAGDANNLAATPVSKSFTVLPAAATITASSATRAFEVPNPAFTFTTSGLVHGDTAASLGGAPSLTTSALLNSPAGTYPIVAAQGSLPTANYIFSFNNATLTIVGQTAQTVTFNKIPNVPLSVGTLTLTAHSTSALPVTYTVSGPATISGSRLTLTGAGMVTVTAAQAGNATFNPATPVSRSFTVTP